MDTSALKTTDQDDDGWIGSTLAERYRVDAFIGRGGMGVVYRGCHVELGKRVAIKRLDHLLATDSVAMERFRREAIAASRIESPHVVQVFDWGMSADRTPFIVMELLAGKSLRHKFELEGRLTSLDAVRIAAQILKGLRRIHEAYVLHRDLKPENVFLCEGDPDGPFVKLLDFGISKSLNNRAEDSVTSTGVVLGTAAYMSPEQAQGESSLDERSDLYSLGAMLYEALTGQLPHAGRTYEAMLVSICTKDCDDVRVHCPLVSSALSQVVAKALARDREQRFATATEFLKALQEATPELEGQFISGDHPNFPTRVSDSRAPDGPLASVARPIASKGHSRARRGTLAIVALALLSAAGIYWRHKASGVVKVGPAATDFNAMASEKTDGTATSAAVLPSTLPVPLEIARAMANPEATNTDLPPKTKASGNGNSTRRAAMSPAPATTHAASPAGVVGGLKLKRDMP